MKIVKRNRNSIIYAWIISYAAILLIPIIGFTAVYIALNKTAVNQLEQYNNFVMDSLMTSFNNNLSESTKIVTFINDSQNVNSIMAMTDIDSGEQYYLLSELKNEMWAYTNNMGIKSRFYVYFKNIDMIVSGNEAVNSHEFYNMNYRQKGFSYEDWIEKITEVNKPYCAIGENSSIFFYRAMLPIRLRYKKKASLVVEMERNDLIQQMRSKDDFSFDFVVLGAKKEVIVETDGISDSKLKSLRAISEDGMYSIDGKKYMVKIADNSTQGYIGICMTMHKNIIGRMRLVDGLCIGAVMVIIAFGIYIIRKNVKKNYLPLEKIAQNAGELFSENSNEYEVIYKAINRIKSDNRDLENVLDKQKKQLRNNYLCRCMKYKTSGDDTVLRSRYGIEFAGDNFIVLLFHFEDYKEFFKDETDISEGEKFDVIMDLMKNVMEEVAQMNGIRGYIVDIDGTTAMLLSFDDARAGSAEDTALEIARFGREFFASQLKIYFKTALSDLQAGVGGISLAYHQAVNIMEYSMPLKNEYVFSAKILLKNHVEYRYDFETEQKFMNYIKSGRTESAENVINDVFKKLIEVNASNMETLTVQIYDMIGTLLKIKQDCGCNSIEIPTKWDDIGQLKEALKESVREMCEFCAARANTQIKNQVEEYVSKYYFDVNLGVSQIAEGLHIHRSYLSTMFKNQSGMGVLEYISRYRLKKAKELLKEGKLTIEQVSAAVGYNEPRTLQRIFKKYEGLTPLQFSKLHKNEEEK